MTNTRGANGREYARLVEQETLIADATELLCELLAIEGLERQELARRLGKSKGFVTQVLSGERNMTLRTLADLAFALGHRFELRHAPVTAERSYRSAISPRLVPPEPRVIHEEFAEDGCRMSGRQRRRRGGGRVVHMHDLRRAARRSANQEPARYTAVAS